MNRPAFQTVINLSGTLDVEDKLLVSRFLLAPARTRVQSVPYTCPARGGHLEFRFPGPPPLSEDLLPFWLKLGGGTAFNGEVDTEPLASFALTTSVRGVLSLLTIRIPGKTTVGVLTLHTIYVDFKKIREIPFG